MWCPRLTHNVRLNPNHTVSLCGHMVDAPQFDSYDSLTNSSWLQSVKDRMSKNIWPAECVRCQQTEEANQKSIRTHCIDQDLSHLNNNYLSVSGVLDNTCNSACMSCNEHLSTRIADLKKIYPVVNNVKLFDSLPQERIVHLDISGGEPSYSKNYRQLLENIPPNLHSIRINTNGSRVMRELITLVEKGIKVTVTVSLDGIGAVHDFVRWPILWQDFYKNLLEYQQMPGIQLNTWTTISTLNIVDLPNILNFVAEHNIDHDYAFLAQPDPINVKYKNSYTETAKKMLPKNIADQVAIDRNNQSDIDRYLIKQKELRNL